MGPNLLDLKLVGHKSFACWAIGIKRFDPKKGFSHFKSLIQMLDLLLSMLEIMHWALSSFAFTVQIYGTLKGFLEIKS